MTAPRGQRWVGAMFVGAGLAMLALGLYNDYFGWLRALPAMLLAYTMMPIPVFWQYWDVAEYGLLLTLSGVTLRIGAPWAWLLTRAVTSLLMFQLILVYFYEHFASYHPVVEALSRGRIPTSTVYVFLKTSERIGLYSSLLLAAVLRTLAWVRPGARRDIASATGTTRLSVSVAITGSILILGLLHARTLLNVVSILGRIGSGLADLATGDSVLYTFAFTVELPKLCFGVALILFVLAQNQRNSHASDYLVLATLLYTSHIGIKWFMQSYWGFTVDYGYITYTQETLAAYVNSAELLWRHLTQEHMFALGLTTLAAAYFWLQERQSRLAGR